MQPTFIDLRSDTVTLPTAEMRDAMKNAVVGDDVFQDDPTVNALETLAAETLGKEAALFLPSGTMANQISIMTHTTPGDEIIAGAQSHIVHYELGAAARFSGVGYALVDRPDHTIQPEDISRLVRPKADPFHPETTLICVENALCDGSVVPLKSMKETYQTAQNFNIPVHLDGARIFNAAHTLGVPAKELAQYSDTVMFCVSKGLCSPVGSLLCGSNEFIKKARRNRKIMGGSMRQAGVLAACGLLAIEKMVPLLKNDHDNAKYLGKELSLISGIHVNQDKIQINMVFWETTIPGFNSSNLVSFMEKQSIKILGEAEGVYRFVTNHDVTKADIDTVIATLKEYIATL